MHDTECRKRKKIWVKISQDTDRMVCHNKDKIGKKLMEYNKNHFSKAKDSKVCKDKIHESLTNDNVRDKMLRGDLNRDDCAENCVRKFLCLVKRRVTTQIDNSKEVTEKEFRKLVKQSKRRSTYSMFSKRDY